MTTCLLASRARTLWISPPWLSEPCSRSGGCGAGRQRRTPPVQQVGGRGSGSEVASHTAIAAWSRLADVDETGASDDHAPVENQPLEFECPRCRDATTQMFYGPCELCRSVLRATVTGEAHEVEVGTYEPKMNVTPNAVALKD